VLEFRGKANLGSKSALCGCHRCDGNGFPCLLASSRVSLVPPLSHYLKTEDHVPSRSSPSYHHGATTSTESAPELPGLITSAS
jgi:hypothetical protein